MKTFYYICGLIASFLFGATSVTLMVRRIFTKETKKLSAVNNSLTKLDKEFNEGNSSLEELIEPLRTPEQKETHRRFEEIYQHYANKAEKH